MFRITITFFLFLVSALAEPYSIKRFRFECRKSSEYVTDRKFLFFENILDGTNPAEKARCNSEFDVLEFRTLEGVQRYANKIKKSGVQNMRPGEVVGIIDQNPDICNEDTLFAYFLNKETAGCALMGNKIQIYTIDLRGRRTLSGRVWKKVCFIPTVSYSFIMGKDSRPYRLIVLKSEK